MARLGIAILVSFLLTLYAEQASADGRRVALVVGVGAYQSVPQLPNAVSDATAIAEMLRKAGFDVVAARSDVGNLEFKRAIRDFEDAAADSDIAVVFYAGHGIEIRETNYLIPTDAKLLNERDAEDEAISLDRIITALEPAKRLRLVILDACRDNPFGTKMKRRVASRAITAGLGKVEPAQTDTLIAYAAKEKSVANDGEGAHSPFTTALLASLTVPGLDVRLAFGRVRDDVMRATGHKQEPFVYGSLGGGTVALVPAKAETASARGEANDAKSDYEIVERVGKKEAWEVFLNAHKTGMYAELARVQIAKLVPAGSDASITRMASNGTDGGLNGMAATAPGARTSPPVEPPPIAPAPKPGAAEQRAWDRLKLSTDQAALRKFIETYPNSLLLPEVQDRLDVLQRLAREREEAVRLEREAARQRDEDEKQKKAAEVERKQLEREAAKQREEAERARAAEALRQKAEAMAAAKQREAEERARAAEAAAHKREEEEAARLAEVAVRRREAEARAQALAAERQRAEAEAAARKREAEAASRAVEAAKAAREAEERSRAQAARDQANQDSTTEAQAKAAAKATADARAAEERDRARAAETLARQKAAEERTKAAEAARRKAASETVATDRENAERARIAEAAHRRAKEEAQAERRRAEAAAEAAAERQAERAAAVRRREAAENARAAADEAAAANRRRAAEATKRAAERQADRAAAAADQRRRAAQQAKEANRARAAQAARPAPAQRARVEARVSAPPPRYSGGGGGGGGGAAPMVGIGF
ncbi:caspase domain-containing protein [uncultured Methylobacterium sp.]|uniref:caspase family protein n=1 Tax=uncultured Methylobacterium sp. TaxID=157278 RepID=UPI0035CC4830